MFGCLFDVCGFRFKFKFLIYARAGGGVVSILVLVFVLLFCSFYFICVPNSVVLLCHDVTVHYFGTETATALCTDTESFSSWAIRVQKPIRKRGYLRDFCRCFGPNDSNKRIRQPQRIHKVIPLARFLWDEGVAEAEAEGVVEVQDVERELPVPYRMA